MSDLKKTPLNQVHHDLGGKMVDFAGWEMPIQYSGVIAEHLNTRQQVSLFDVSHMGEIYIQGKDALENLQNLTCNDVSAIEIGQVQYSAFLYENGTFVDDITIYRLGEQSYFLCVNAANTEKDWKWIQSHCKGDVSLENRSSEIAQIAIQGKGAIAVLKELTSESIQEIRYYWFREISLCGHSVTLARMGYTGEDGFEIFCSKEVVVELWEKLMDAGKNHNLLPAGLAARDTLRLEACFPLYGQDIDDQHHPLEAGLGRFVKLDKEFIGSQAVREAKEEGIKRKLVRFVFDKPGVPRAHYRIFDEQGENPIGEVTSGTSSPILKKGIGMGYVPVKLAKVGTFLQVEVRNKMCPITVIKPPFVKS